MSCSLNRRGHPARRARGVVMAAEVMVTDRIDRNVEWIDDVLIDTDTGEILQTRHPTPFVVDSIETAEWVLDRMARREAALVALEARKQALFFNFEALINTELRALDGLHRRFDAELETFAREKLAADGGRTKTIRTAFGSIRFRIVRASRKIGDMAAAVAWAKHWMPEVVRTKEDVLISDLERGGDLPIGAPWLETRLEEERCYIETGVETQ